MIQWSTGNVGHHAARLIARHPDLELVGLWVHSPDKVGRDVGELIGIEPLGITATNDVDELLALGADCVSYTATADLRPTEAIDDMARILASGANVVSSSVVPLLYPPHVDPMMRAPLEEACTTGGHVVLHLRHRPGLGQRPAAAGADRQLRVHRLGPGDGDRQLRHLRAARGAVRHDGLRPAARRDAAAADPGVLSFAWGGVVRGIAAALGAEIDELVEVHERLPAPADIDLGFGVVEAGTTAAMRFEVQGVINGTASGSCSSTSPASTTTLAPDWPQPAGHSGYRVVVTRQPELHRSTCR